MREPGADCPECSEPIFRGKCTACGWAAKSARQPDKVCAVCHATFSFWQDLHHGEDNLRRCGRCHMEYLKSRTAGLEDVCTEPGCRMTVREHIEACKRLVAAIGEMPPRRPPRTNVVDLPKEDYSVEWQQKKWAALTRLREGR